MNVAVLIGLLPDIAILLNDKYDVRIDFEKDGAVQSAILR